MKISELCQKSLDEKWYKGSDSLLVSSCPFCKDNNGYCITCLCPKEICAHDGMAGFISELWRKYGRANKISKLEPADLEKMQNLFKKYIKADEG